MSSLALLGPLFHEGDVPGEVPHRPGIRTEVAKFFGCPRCGIVELLHAAELTVAVGTVTHSAEISDPQGCPFKRELALIKRGFPQGLLRADNCHG